MQEHISPDDATSGRRGRGRRRLLATLIVLVAGTVGAIAVGSPASAGCNIPLTGDRGPGNSVVCPKNPDDPPPAPPWMDPQPAPPPMPAPPPAPNLDCEISGDGQQLFVQPIGLKALWYGFTVEYCYNNARDLVRVTPRVLLPQIQLPLEELSRGLPVGSVGTVSVISAIPLLAQITLNDAPVRTSQGQIYAGSFSVTLSFVQRFAAPQTYVATVGVIINDFAAFPTPPLLIRTSG